MAAVSSELSTDQWLDVLQQAASGMLHAHFTGGEPLARPDLTELIAGHAPRAFTPTSLLRALDWLSRDCRHWSGRTRSHPDQLSGFA